MDDLLAGAPRVAELGSFYYKDAEGKDHGLNVRLKSATLVQLMADASKITEARAKALANRNKYSGVGSTDYPSTRSAAPQLPTASRFGSVEDDEDVASGRHTLCVSRLP